MCTICNLAQRRWSKPGPAGPRQQSLLSLSTTDQFSRTILLNTPRSAALSADSLTAPTPTASPTIFED